jgi:2-polyprenyl-6-hydroxyphenyl methylase/3-demethylubiquinone-9 3-methyltransferase
VADELLRVCRPGGTVGMLNFTPEGLASDFFALFAPYLPAPPADALPPLLWGSEDHVRDLFGERVEDLRLTRRTYVERAATPAAYCAFVKETFGPVAAVYAALAATPERAAALDRAFLAFAAGANRGAPGGPAAFPYEYLLVVARKRGA